MASGLKLAHLKIDGGRGIALETLRDDPAVAMWYFDRFTPWPKSFATRLDIPTDLWDDVLFLDHVYETVGSEED